MRRLIMPGFISRRQFVSRGVLSFLGLTAAGCGTVMHPERKGQSAGKLDWEIVALDAVGLLLFFVPGVIAFAVDFNNGTIYLPTEPTGKEEGQAQAATDQRRSGKLLAVAAPGPMTLEAIERTVASKTQRPVSLVPGSYLTRKLERLEQFWTMRKECEVG